MIVHRIFSNPADFTSNTNERSSKPSIEFGQVLRDVRKDKTAKAPDEQSAQTRRVENKRVENKKNQRARNADNERKDVDPSEEARDAHESDPAAQAAPAEEAVATDDVNDSEETDGKVSNEKKSTEAKDDSTPVLNPFAAVANPQQSVDPDGQSQSDEDETSAEIAVINAIVGKPEISEAEGDAALDGHSPTATTTAGQAKNADLAAKPTDGVKLPDQHEPVLEADQDDAKEQFAQSQSGEEDASFAELFDSSSSTGDEKKAETSLKIDQPLGTEATVSSAPRTSSPQTTGAVPALAKVAEPAFTDVNHPRIISSMKSELLPNGGTMHIRLDPPELGALQVTVHMRDGQMTASFQTSNDDATRLLSHTLNQLKQSLEATGVSVDKIHVQQVPRDADTGSSAEDQQKQQAFDDRSSQQEQQRKEMLKRMWRRLGGRDDLDMVA